MDFWEKKVWRIPLFVIILVEVFGVIGVTAVVMYTLTLPATLTVEEPVTGATYEIKAYSDEACTNELTSLNFGTHKAGTSATLTFYVRNLSSENITLGWKI